MTDQQPKALRLADWLEQSWKFYGEQHMEAAAELRRLHAELERLKADIENHVRIAAELATENEQLRNALAESVLQHDVSLSVECPDCDARHGPFYTVDDLIAHLRQPDDTDLLRQALEVVKHCGCKHPDMIEKRGALEAALRERLGSEP